MPNLTDTFSQAIDAVGRLVKSGTKVAGEDALALITELQKTAPASTRPFLDRAEKAVRQTLESGALFVANVAASALYEGMTLAGKATQPEPQPEKKAEPAKKPKPAKKAPRKAKSPKKARKRKRDA